MSYDPEKEPTVDEMTEFIEQLYEMLDDPEEAGHRERLRAHLEAHGIDVDQAVAKGKAIIAEHNRRQL